MSQATWSRPALAAAAAPAEAAEKPPVRLLIVAQPARAQAFYANFAADARFAVQAIATSASDARAKLALDVEVALVEVVAFTGPKEFAAVFQAYRGAVWALLAPDMQASDADAVREVACVAQVLPAETNLPALAGEMYAAALGRRPAQAAGEGGFAPLRDGVATIGFRSIAVWSPQGGVGKSTIALALALEASTRRLPALLVGLGAPDGIPLILEGIRPEPNILNWRANPGHPDGLRAAIQVHKRTGQHILVGFRDPTAVGGFEASTGPTSISNLAFQASMAGYAIVVKDVMAGQHAIPDGGIYLVLNRVRDTTLRPDEVVSYGKRERRDFPPLAAYVADDPNVEVAINRLEPAYYGSESLRRAAKTLGDLLFPAAVASAPDAGQPARVVKVGPLRVRL